MEKEIIKLAKTRKEAIIALYGKNNGWTRKCFEDLIEKLNIDISHFPKTYEKCEVVTKICPICLKKFTTKANKKEKTTCSRSCANSYFRTGVNHGNYKDITEYSERTHTFARKYREICFNYHPHKCVVCEESLVLDVHHFDGDKFNNTPSNLIPLCATHHNYVHSIYKNMVINTIIEYRDSFINTFEI
jgi:hypothetical protein